MAVDQARRPQQSPVKRFLIGRRHATSRLPHTLLPKILALPIFSSDPLSSVAYDTEQIMVVLLAASSTSRHLVLPISLVIASVLAIVVVSYRQTVRAYPSGGGSYIVSKDNLGTFPALVAAAALRVDGGRRRGHRGGRRWALAVHRGAVARVRRPAHPGQPSGRQGDRRGVRVPDLRLRRVHPLHARGGPDEMRRVRLPLRRGAAGAGDLGPGPARRPAQPVRDPARVLVRIDGAD